MAAKISSSFTASRNGEQNSLCQVCLVLWVWNSWHLHWICRWTLWTAGYPICFLVSKSPAVFLVGGTAVHRPLLTPWNCHFGDLYGFCQMLMKPVESRILWDATWFWICTIMFLSMNSTQGIEYGQDGCEMDGSKDKLRIWTCTDWYWYWQEKWDGVVGIAAMLFRTREVGCKSQRLRSAANILYTSIYPTVYPEDMAMESLIANRGKPRISQWLLLMTG